MLGLLLVGLAATACSGGSPHSAPATTAPTTTLAPESSTTTPGVTIAAGEVAVWQCQDGRRLRLEADGRWHYEGTPPNPGGATDPKFIAELFQCHGKAVAS